MTKFIARRVVRGFVSLILFQSLLFGLLHALPYDISSLYLGGPGIRAFIRQQFGLDLPLWEQYARWLAGFLRFDLGESYLYWPTPVLEIVVVNMPRTLILFFSAAILAYIFGIWLGKVVAWRRGGFLEAGASLAAVAAYTSFPSLAGPATTQAGAC